MNLYVVGKIVGCFGIQGYVKVHPLTSSIDRFAELHKVYVGDSDESPLPMEVEEVIIDRTPTLMKLQTVRDRNDAERIVGNFLFVDESDVRKPEAGSFFVHDVIGCSVSTNEGRFVGVVENVCKFTAQDVWVVKNGTTEHLIPAVKEFVERVDVNTKTIIINPIEGLLNEIGRGKRDED